MRTINRRVKIVDSILAFHMGRLAAARQNATGLDVLTLPVLAGRLAGGFCHIVDRNQLSTATSTALAAGGFGDIEEVRELPGTVRAVMETLRRVWMSDLDLDILAQRSPRLADIALVQTRIRRTLSPGAMLPRDLRDAAISRVQFAKALFGQVTLDRIFDIEPVWRPLIAALAARIPVHWISPAGASHDWFTGSIEAQSSAECETNGADLCADPRAEVVEALRWARALLSTGKARAADIAIVSAATATWDEHMLVLSREAELPLHFSHGIPALNSSVGQSCAALADIMMNGLSQDRIRRLFRWASPRFTQMLPRDWATGLSRHAGLFTLNHWRQALAGARLQRKDGDAAERILLPLLELLAQGPLRAEEAAKLILPPASLGLWTDALRIAPAAAVSYSLQRLRIRDSRDPGNSIVWGPASDLVGAPRKHVRLLGLVARMWPRIEAEDSLIPDHVLPRRTLRPVSITRRDRLAFNNLFGSTHGSIALSRSQRSSEGSLQCGSALWPISLVTTIRSRTRTPEHAFSEADRILARPQEAGRDLSVQASRTCWRDWHKPDATPHDGLTRAEHPAVRRTLTKVHSPKSLRRLVRDPLGFIWRYALGMQLLPLTQRPLVLDALVFGELVHELLRQAVNLLEPKPGFVRASREEIEIAIERAVEVIREDWPLSRPVPPPLLWTHALEAAARRSFRALTVDETFQPETRSWTEIEFGPDTPQVADGPWNTEGVVTIGAHQLQLSGRIDRVDVTAGGAAIRLSDYKTGAVPDKVERIILDRGRELQRVLYAMAAKQLCPNVNYLVSRLVYLSAETMSVSLRGRALESAAMDVSSFIDIAYGLLTDGKICPGPDAQERFNDLRLALPADLNAYFRRKAAAFGALQHDLAPLWSKA